MRLLFIIIFASFVIELHASKKAHLHANEREDPSFVKMINQGLEDEMELSYFKKPGDDDSPMMEFVKDNALHELLQDSLPEIASGGDALLAKIYAFETRSQQKGIDSIQAIADHVKQKLEVKHFDLSGIVKKTTSDYITMLKNYFSDLVKEKPSNKVDQEYIILDMVNVVTLMRIKCEKSLLKKILNLVKTTDIEEIDILTGTIQIFNDNDKQQEMDFICANFKSCRPNPTITEYMFRFLDTALNLKNKRLKYLLVKISQLLLTKQPFFKTVLRGEIFEFLKAKLIGITSIDANEIRDFVGFLHSTVLRRYKINRTNSIKIQTKARSAYIILDIIDVAFGIDGNDVYKPPMEKMIIVVKEWPTFTAKEIVTILYDTIQYIVEALTYNINERAKKEIMALADIIFYTENVTQPGTEYLLTEGSKFVKGLIHKPEPRKYW